MEEILQHAERLEKEYDWLGATESYKKALNLLSNDDFSRKGDVTERLGYAFYRGAFQAENNDEFRDRLHQSVANYQRTREFYGRLNEQARAPRIFRGDAMIAFMGYWLAPGVSEKKRLLGECWQLTKQALNGFGEAGDVLEYGETYDRLSKSVALEFLFEWDSKTREKMLKEAVEYGEEAIKLLFTVGDSYELARAYVIVASFLELFGSYFLDLDERQRYFQKAQGYWQKANELSEETAMVELLDSVLTIQESLGWLSGSDKALTNFEKALDYGRKTKNKLIVGLALDNLAYHTLWRAFPTEDPDIRMELLEKVLQYAKDAKRQYSPISFTSPNRFPSAEAPYVVYYWALSLVQTNLEKKRSLLEKLVEAEPDWRKLAEASGYPEAIENAHHGFSVILTDLAKLETNSEKKKKLLEKALEQRNESIRLTEQIGPFQYWNQGLMKSYLSDIQSELAVLAEDPENKKNILEEAALNKENSLKLFIRATGFREMKGGTTPQQAFIGSLQSQYGNLLKRLYECTGNTEHLRRAVKAFEDAAEQFQKLDIMSRVAECYWKIAQVCDALDKHPEAAESFTVASNNYRTAAEKIPQLKDFYQNLSLYMQAWSEIEKARQHHAKQEYGIAEEHFEKAADLHKSLKQWNYLALNYAAWAQVEHAEEMSRKEQGEEAIQAFEQAAKLFNVAKKSLETKLSEIEDPDEEQMVTNMLKAINPRLQYCTARTTLEEARILDKKGDHYSSSEKYGSTAEAFEKIIQALESEQEQKEIKFIMNLARAWQKMTLAEAEASPTLYREASQLFEDTKEFGPTEQAKMLALGHSRFCRALEAGTIFADTGDTSMHAAAVQYLESAAKYYVNAGLQTASEYAEATEMLFDAYVHMDKAKKESDPEKKTRLCMMAEKVLQTSAGSFMKAEHQEKREQVLRLLEKVKKERELAISLAELLHAPSIVSTTTALPTPTLSYEAAVGSEEFENANIQANLITRQRELKIGENLHLEMELVNAGKGPALLIKVNEIIPQGFELTEKPEIYRVEDSHLNMKGKRLDPLKTEEVRLVLKPKAKGVFALKPTILYLDENGKYKSHSPEPVNITVKELGIKGWIKGER